LKVLLDENLPHNLRHSLVGHHVMSVDYMGWSGEKNGELLTLCEAEGFDVLLTGDQNLSYQQIIADRRIAVVILDTLDLNVLRKVADRIVDAIDRATPGELPGCAIKLDGCAATETEQADRVLGKSGTSRTIEQYGGSFVLYLKLPAIRILSNPVAV